MTIKLLKISLLGALLVYVAALVAFAWVTIEASQIDTTAYIGMCE